MRRAAGRTFARAALAIFTAMSGGVLAACVSDPPESRREEAPRPPGTLPDAYKHPPR